VRFLAIFLLLTASATQLAAQDPVAHLVRDIDPTSYAGSSRPRDLVDVGNGLSFTAFGRTELWVVDLRQGTVGAVLRGAEIRPLGADLYAVRDDSGLWTLNMLVRFRLGVYLASIPGGPFVRIGEPIEPEGFWGPRVFAADDGTGEALWIVGAYGPDASNGRAVEIARPAPLPSGRLARNVVAISGGTAFVARSPNGALGFWVTDGTAAGTHSILPAPGAELRDVVIVGHLGGGTAVLLVDDPHARCNGKQLWLSDGTAAGTRPLLPALDGPCLQVSSAVAFYDRILAIGDDGVHGREIWRSDGTAAGTAAVTNFRPRDPFGARPLTAVDREGDVGIVFFADDGVHGREPWVTEVTRGSARLLADLCPDRAPATARSGPLLTTTVRGFC
jgi:ELWxxDGT repeat protein